MDWYTQNTEKLKELFPADYETVAALIAATSPRRDLKRNLRTAIAIYKTIKKFPNLLNLSPAKFMKRFEIMPAHYNNVLRALSGKKLSGLKVEAFRNNLCGNLEAVTIDIWMLRFFNFTGAKVTPKQYSSFELQIKELAAAEGIAPAQMQSIIWNKTRQQFGFKPVNFDFKNIKG